MISVLILTAGRPQHLQRCLDALMRGMHTPEEIAVLVTRPDRETEDLLRGFTCDALQWRTWETESGSYAEARNAVVHMAKHQKIAFIDDDCVPADDWLLRASDDLNRFDAVGGIVTPSRPLAYPAWWDPDMAWMAGFSVPRALNDPSGAFCYPQAANLAMRRAVAMTEPFQEMGGKFSSTLQDYAVGREDAELWRRLRVKGYATALDPELQVFHHIPQERLQYEALLTRARHDGSALMRREMNEVAMQQAWRDEAYWPLSIARQYLFKPWPNDPQRTADRLWHARQKQLLKTWLEVADEAQMETYRRARKAAVKHVITSEFKRPLGKAIIGINRVIGPRKDFVIPPRRALVVSAGYLGDAILTTIVANSWRISHPSIKVDAAVTSNSAFVLLHDQQVFDRVHRISVKPGPVNPSLKQVIDGGEYDVIIAPHFHSAIYPRMSHLFRPFGPPVITFNDDNGMERHSDRMRASLRLHIDPIRNMLLSIADLFSIAAPMQELRQWMPHFLDSEAEQAEQFVKEINSSGKTLIALHPGAGKPDKEWEWERWFELADALEKRGFCCLFICDDTLLPRLRSDLERHDLQASVAVPDIRQMALILRMCAMLISPDTGPRHLAAAMNSRTIGIYGGMDERRWGPWFNPQDHANIRAATWDLLPEELAGLPQNHQCTLVSVQQVMAAVEKIIIKTGEND